MNLRSRKTMFYGLMLVAAFTGLLIDRSQPAHSTAADNAELSGLPVGDEADELDLSLIGPPIAAIFCANGEGGANARNPSPQLTGRVRDIFALSAQMQQHYQSHSEREQKKLEAEVQQKEKEAQQIIDAFQSQYTLKGTFIQPQDVWAVVNDQILRVGDQLADFTLCKIERYRVVFKRGQLVTILGLPNPLDVQVQPTKQR